MMMQKRLPLLSGLFLAAILPSGFAGLSDIYNFTDGSDGAAPQSGLVQGANGLLYGTAVNGGSNGFGAVFSVTTGGNLTPLYSFTGGNDGAAPWGGLTFANGNLYGTTTSGGAGAAGTIYEITPSGGFSLVYTFTGGNDGASPQGNLVLGTDGNLYGTATAGGASGQGTIFRITQAGGFTPLYSFTGGADGSTPLAGLAVGPNDVLYGSTGAGGGSTNGTLFKIDTSGNFTLLYTFAGGADGGAPQASLVTGNDGNFYGVATAGGGANNGTLFQLTPGGNFKGLYSFSADGGTGTNSDGIDPVWLVAGSDGNLYGVAANGGANGSGTIFKSSLAGAVTTLYSFGAVSGGDFSNSDGANPSGIMQGADGNFYGTTASGGPLSLGSLFAYTGAGTIQFLTPAVQFVNGQAVLTLSGGNGQSPIIVDASTDLTQWAPILTNPPTSGQIQVTDSAAASFAHRFYRARQAGQ